MKKFLTFLVLFISVLMCFGCNETETADNKFKLTVIDDFGYLYKPLNESYEAGEEVDVQIIFLSGGHGGINLNGEHITTTKVSTDYPGIIYTFNMPNKDSTLYTTSSGYILKDCGSEDAHQYDEGRADVLSSIAPPPIIYTCKLCGHKKTVQQELNFSKSFTYLHGNYYGECIYENPALSSLITEKEFYFDYNKYNNIECEKKDNIDNFFDNLFESPFYKDLPIEDLKEVTNINYYELSVNDGLHQGIYIFKVDSELYLFEANERNGEYAIWRGYKLLNNTKEPSDVINTKANFTFFPTGKSDLHNEELKAAYESYMIEHNWDLSSWGDYEIYNFISEENSEKYNLDIFQVYYSKSSYYFIKHNNDVYQISPFDLNNENSNCINHIAITDINNDGHIEILTAINSFADRSPRDYYCTSFIMIIDTHSKHSIKITDYKNLNYFKENEDGVISIYNTDGTMPNIDNLHDGILDEKYYYLANNLFDTPVLNTSKYEFKEQYIKTSCDLFEVEVTISDGTIKFPYLFKSTYTAPSLTINVKMTYLGETFGYTSPDGYLDGATVSFVNENDTISCEGWCATCVVSKFIIFKGQVIERDYKYNESLNKINEVGLYDMVITYENEETNLKESIVIEDFLQLTR